VFSGPTPPSFQGYEQNQNDLLVRYIFELTPDEQHRLSGMMPKTAPASKASSNAPARKRLAGKMQAPPGSASMRAAAPAGGSR
jgi:hypothetical protein